ncbi:DUF4184 family protein [Microbacterium esteraromaticum]|uniref:DUF4184 family protein n=1 Tax=Microbacterium esteraromaticum TaxID=57043 RepID=UPI001CD4BAF1|nr:DUF4184 family protein [Microbacterium esteraromaticum]MCA1307574.1 DUF4184 family protein [Microbacterium esteraromaticum]
MPFTPSHAVVALPFVRTPLVPAAIAIGAMTPDLPLFLRGFGVPYGFTHSVANVVWTTLIAFVLFAVWRVVMRPGLVALAPDALASRLPDQWRQTGRRAAAEAVGARARFGYPLLLVLSLMIGVLSHIVWDLFTHEGRWGVEAIPALQAAWGPLPGYKWLQYGSSAFGLALIGIWMLIWLRRRPVAPRPALLPTWLRWAWMAALPIVLVSAWMLGLAAYGPLTDEFTVRHLAYATLPAASGLWGVLTVLLCVAIVIVPRRTAAPIAHHDAVSAPHSRGDA